MRSSLRTFRSTTLLDCNAPCLIPEIHECAPHAEFIPRTGQINAWDNPPFVEAIEKSGRKTMVIAGTLTSVCLAFPAISAIEAEFGCSLLLIVGLGTRLAAIPLAFTMVVALFIVHGADPWQKKELAAVYLAVYAVLISTGAGKLSLDYLWAEKGKPVQNELKE